MKKVIILSALLIFSAGQVSLSAPKVRKVKKTEENRRERKRPFGKNRKRRRFRRGERQTVGNRKR